MMVDRNNPKLSIIIPVYNAEKSLHRCIDSILTQAFTDYELLVIDDGSKDKSRDILDEYARKDERVRVFSQPNSGVSSARNLGLDKARGKWITFVDADDYISSGFLDAFEGKNADLIIGRHLCFNSQNEFKENGDLPIIDVSEEDDVKQFLMDYMVFNIMRTPWGKFLKRSLLSNLRFDGSLRVGEDTAFLLQYLAKCNSISVVETDATYCYYDDENQSKKYEMTPAQALYHLKRVFGYYELLDIKCLQFEKLLLEYYYSLCHWTMRYQSSIWFGDKFVVKLIASLKPVVTSKRYFRMQLMQIPLFYNLWLYKSEI